MFPNPSHQQQRKNKAKERIQTIVQEGSIWVQWEDITCYRDSKDALKEENGDKVKFLLEEGKKILVERIKYLK